MKTSISVNRTSCVLIVAAVLLITAHRLPAPIQEVPESPTPAPEQSANPKSKQTPKPKTAAQDNGESIKQRTTKTSEQSDRAATKLDAASRGSPTRSTTAQTSTLPYAIPVPGHPNLVSSPYVRGVYIDIEGLPPGTEVRDPYAPSKTFLVPRVQR
jgi:hypothetical protein